MIYFDSVTSKIWRIFRTIFLNDGNNILVRNKKPMWSSLMLEKQLNYRELISQIKNEIIEAQNRAIISVNKELIMLYWKIGNNIIQNQDASGWGSKIIPQLSKDLKTEFPNLKGFSERNLKYMKKFAEEYTEIIFVQQVVAQISWSHNLVLLDRVKVKEERIWYIKSVLKINGLEIFLFIKLKVIFMFDKLLLRKQLTIIVF